MSAGFGLAIVLALGAYIAGVEYTIVTIEHDHRLSPRWYRISRWRRFLIAALWPITLGVLCIAGEERWHE